MIIDEKEVSREIARMVAVYQVLVERDRAVGQAAELAKEVQRLRAEIAAMGKKGG